ncbi:sulfur carrier protein ThiS [Modestobacter italicus]|uniref:sulfur carrier protein ThiS n=1 Tax=Modestobacter italicus (strain DSM 44449 / CECT 9708 / BC 501) TaxID=2732864 RepID=UPI001C949EDC|nr:sulfur carrier protein ThiS [Modestobacter italicus]
MTVPLTVNGVPAEFPAGTTVATLVAERNGGHDRVAVARNSDVVPRSSWATTELSPGDRLEVLAPTAGG